MDAKFAQIERNAVRLEIKVEEDKYPFFRKVRIGEWLHTYDYETGEGEWTWRPVERCSNINANGLGSSVSAQGIREADREDRSSF
jgi:hypothetical protein